MNKKLWQRFTNSNDSNICHQCPHAIKVEKTEPRLDPNKYPNLHESFYALVDRSVYKPNQDNVPCLACYESWLEEAISDGKICIRCQEWLTKNNKAMIITSKYADGILQGEVASQKTLCTNCFMNALNAKVKAKETK